VEKHLSYSEAWNLGYKLGLDDSPDQDNYIGTGGFKGHSAAFTAGYNCGFGGVCPSGFIAPLTNSTKQDRVKDPAKT
jgi:hypothetical protein